ncbi:hypothetical protein [Myxacorys almedinensis]|uniref:Uncharacterized protein n=1 Tax=Myxacorys almedinensis A TaxID=2690445 RepID=A0A8J7Z2E4_9CYAN|nr:hypothetical protein [Myxacorys almedinensis]NDJ16898.1 hypothetical protein [Myxacorys almedinensis A]
MNISKHYAIATHPSAIDNRARAASQIPQGSLKLDTTIALQAVGDRIIPR